MKVFIHAVSRSKPSLTPVLTHIACLALMLSAPLSSDAASLTGKQIYLKQCASCHGKNGQGVNGEYEEPLTGKRSLPSLAKYIHRQMPEEEPKQCIGDDARKVAKYIFDAFYSPAAHARIKPPKIELSRLTLNQYKNSIADLIASFRPKRKPATAKGLRADYFNDGRRFNSSRRVFSRIETIIKHDFGPKSPHKKLNAKRFAIRWSGSVFASQSGKYEFIIHSPNGIKLFVNNKQTPIIDALVRSGDLKSVRASIHLLAGRSYPFRVEMVKLSRDKTANITLNWKPPYRTEHIIPPHLLSPTQHHETLIINTPFPPDDRSRGYERGSNISRAWHEATTYAAIEAAQYVTNNLQNLTSIRPKDPNAAKTLSDFCVTFARRAFRRPLTPTQKTFFVTRYFQNTKDLELAVKKSILLILKSPRFLFHSTAPNSNSPTDPHYIASRIAFALWDSIPDKILYQAAESGNLKTDAQITAQITRMRSDHRTKAKILDFYHRWLLVDRLHELNKDKKQFPDFNKQIIADLRSSLDMFLDDVTWNNNSDFRDLLLSDNVYLNSRLASFYNVKLPPNTPFKKTSLKSQQHSGILTHPLLMAGFAYNQTSSPIHRGVFISRSLLGRRLRPPPIAVTPTPQDLHPNLTTRQRIAKQTSPKSCASCHDMINPLGFALENYDAAGRFRTTERGKPLDTQGHYQTLAGDVVQFKSAPQLGKFLASSIEAQDAFIERLFQHMIKQPILAYGLNTPQNLHKSFAQNKFSIKHLIVEITKTAATTRRKSRTGKSK